MTTFTKNRGGRGGSSRESHGHQELSRVNKVATAQFGGHSLGIYIQVPFCQTKCTYCNFHTGVASRDRYWPYAEAVCREIAEKTPSKEIVDTVYFGGGTPSLLDPAALTKILESLRSFYRTAFCEVTLEADPETITPEKASAWLAGGFNRI